MVRVTVLKSLRTKTGANDWLKTMKHQFPDAEVMGTDVLKTFPDVAYTVDPTGFSNHVVIQEDLTPVIEAISSGEFGDLVSEFIKAGYVEVDNYGLCLTDKWHSCVNDFMKEAFERGLETFKSTSKVKAPPELDSFLSSFNGILKSLGIPSVPENNTHGEEPRTPVAISDEEAEAAEQNESAPEADLEDKKVEVVAGDESSPTVTKKAATEDEEETDDEEEDDEDLPEVFKSLGEARNWDNPDPSRYYVDAMTFHEKKDRGLRYTHIVREKIKSDPVGAFGNKLRR
ncbi:MAG: hypothetical protein WC965_02040 [Thiohalomonadaceae bacterium]